MRPISLLKFLLTAFLLMCGFAFAQNGNPVNPHTQIRWPMPSCASGVYSPSTNTCVPNSGGGGGLNPGSQTQIVNYANPGTGTQGGPTQITTDTLTQRDLNIPGTTRQGVQPNHVNPGSSGYNRIAGLPEFNIMADCQQLTGLAVTGDGTTDDFNAVQQCIWQRMGICPTIGTACTPVDPRFPHPTNVNSTGVTFKFPQRSFIGPYGVGCSYFFSQGLDIPWGANLEGVGAGKGETATQLCWPPGQTGLWVRGFSVIQHLQIYTTGAQGWQRTNAATFILPVGFGGSGTGDGIVMGTDNVLSDVFVRYFGRHGIDCDSARTDWPNGFTTDLCDANTVDNVQIYNSRGWAVHVNGSDGGVNIFKRISAYQNQLGGIYNTSLYSNHYDSFLGDANHSDATLSTGVVPSISSTVCTATACTATTSASHGLFPGDLVTQTGCSDSNLNTPSILVLSTPTASTYTYNNFGFLGAESPTGCAVTYRLGTHVWAAAGSLNPSQPAYGGCVMAPQGHFTNAYCEGDQPFGTFAPGSGFVQTSIVDDPQGVAKFAPLGAYIGSAGSTLVTSDVWAANPNSLANTRIGTTTGGQSSTFAEFYNTDPTATYLQPGTNNPSTYVNSENQIFSRLTFRRTFYGPGKNTLGTLANWDCFMLPGNVTGTLSLANGCMNDQTVSGMTAIGVVNGGSGYVAPYYKITSANGTGKGAAFHCTNTGGVLSACVIDSPGAGYTPNIAITVFDNGPGTGAVLSATVGNVASTDTGRSNLNGKGVSFFPNAICQGSDGSFGPLSCWTTGTAAPTTGTWKTSDFVYNTSGFGPFGWECVAGGTPGTWVALSFATIGNNAQLQFSTGLSSNMTAGSQYYFANGVPAGMTGPGAPGPNYGVSTSFAGVARNLFINMPSVMIAGNSVVFNLMKNGVNTALTCTLASGGATASRCNDTSNAVTVAQGDVLMIGAVCSGPCGANSTFNLQATIQIQ